MAGETFKKSDFVVEGEEASEVDVIGMVEKAMMAAVIQGVESHCFITVGEFEAEGKKYPETTIKVTVRPAKPGEEDGQVEPDA